MNYNRKPVSPLFRLFDAGIDLIGQQFTFVAKAMQEHLEASQRAVDERQNPGESADGKRRRNFGFGQGLDTLSTVIAANPLFSLLPRATLRESKRDEQLALLAAKLDALVEQVALLAAKQAREKPPTVSEDNTPNVTSKGNSGTFTSEPTANKHSASAASVGNIDARQSHEATIPANQSATAGAPASASPTRERKTMKKNK